MRSGFVLMLCALVLGACASNAARSSLITADTALITVNGKNGDGRRQLVNAALAEAARFARTQGFRYFIVLDTADASTVARVILPPARVRGEGVSGIPYTRPTPPVKAENASMLTPVGQSVPYVRPALDATIRMFREGEVDPAMDGVFSSETPSPGREG